LKIFNDALQAKFNEAYIENELETSDKLLFYHIQAADGMLKEYGVKQVYSNEPLSIPMASLNKGEVVRVHFDKWTQIFKIEE